MPRRACLAQTKAAFRHSMSPDPMGRSALRCLLNDASHAPSRQLPHSLPRTYGEQYRAFGFRGQPSRSVFCWPWHTSPPPPPPPPPPGGACGGLWLRHARDAALVAWHPECAFRLYLHPASGTDLDDLLEGSCRPISSGCHHP